MKDALCGILLYTAQCVSNLSPLQGMLENGSLCDFRHRDLREGVLTLSKVYQYQSYDFAQKMVLWTYDTISCEKYFWLSYQSRN